MSGPDRTCYRYFRFFLPAPSTSAVFLCALAAATLMNFHVMALRPMPGAFAVVVFFFATVFSWWPWCNADPRRGLWVAFVKR